MKIQIKEKSSGPETYKLIYGSSALGLPKPGLYSISDFNNALSYILLQTNPDVYMMGMQRIGPSSDWQFFDPRHMKNGNAWFFGLWTYMGEPEITFSV